MAQQEHELLTQLCQAVSLTEAKRIVQELEKRFLYTWRAVGDNEANYGLINIASDPGHALIERVTNAAADHGVAGQDGMSGTPFASLRLDLLGDCPHEAGQLAGDGHHGLVAVQFPGGQPAEAPAQAQLRLPGDGA
jgi:hypothetical protein